MEAANEKNASNHESDVVKHLSHRNRGEKKLVVKDIAGEYRAWLPAVAQTWLGNTNIPSEPHPTSYIFKFSC